MSRPAARALLLDLSQRKVAVSVEGGRVRVTAPKGVVTDQLRQDLRHHKPEIVALLQQQEQVLNMSLEQFAQSGLQVELRVPGCSQTLWWVPNSRAAEQLMGQGIGRGRIWTAQELLQVWEGPPLRREDAQTLARMKAALDSELSSIKPPDADLENEQ